MRKWFFISFSVMLNLFQHLAFSQGVWTQKADFGGGPRENAIGFAIGNKGYIGLGVDIVNFTSNYFNDFWEYDPLLNTWTQKANYPGNGRDNASCFAIGSKGYIGIGTDGTYNYKDFWEWNQGTNIWVQKTNFDSLWAYAVSFSIGNKGYIGSGGGSYVWNFFWEWDQMTNIWTQKANTSFYKFLAVGFSIGLKGYIGTGWGVNGYEKDLWEWDQGTNTWSQKANFPGTGRYAAVGFSIGSKGYLGTGMDSTTFKKDFWEYDSNINTWSQQANFGGPGRFYGVGFSIGFRGYIGTGGKPLFKDFWEFTPQEFIGIDEKENKLSLSLFPNPMHESTALQITPFDFAQGDMQFELYDLQGKQVRNIKIQTSNLKLERGALAPGTYIYKVSSPDGAAASGKLVVE